MFFSLVQSSQSGLKHSHKKRKDSLEARAELGVLRSYFEKQAMLEPTLRYRASKCKQTNQGAGQRGLFMNP